MNLFKFFSLKKKSKLTPNQQLELKRINRIRLRTMKHELNEQQYLSMLDTIQTMQQPKDQRYQTMYDG
jgi:hypothetical protein